MRNANGFTLVETLVALLLISVGVLAAAPMFMYAMQGNASGADIGSAGALAVERMELLRSVRYNNLAVGGSVDANAVGFFDNSDPDVTIRWLVVTNVAPVGTKTITVRGIANRQTVGLRKSVTLTTLRGQ